MIGTTIAGIVSQLTYDPTTTEPEYEGDNITPEFFQGAYDELNELTNEENDAFVFLLRPEKWKNDISKGLNVDSRYDLVIGFFKVTNFEDNKITGIDAILNLLNTLFRDFLKETYKQKYSIENLTAEVGYNDESFDNNVSGILATLTFIYKNEFNVCT